MKFKIGAHRLNENTCWNYNLIIQYTAIAIDIHISLAKILKSIQPVSWQRAQVSVHVCVCIQWIILIAG